MSEHDSTCDNSSLPVVNGVEFRPIDGFPGYCVGDDGSLWSKRHKNGIFPVKDRQPAGAIRENVIFWLKGMFWIGAVIVPWFAIINAAKWAGVL